RFTFLIPTSVVRLLRVRHQEKELLRDRQRAHPADPAPAEAGRIEEIKETVGAESILYRDYQSEDVVPFVQKVDVETRTMEAPPNMRKAIGLLKDALVERMTLLAEAGFLPMEAARRLSFKELLTRRDAILRRGSWNARFAYSFCAKAFTLLKYLETQTYRSFLNYHQKIIGNEGRVSAMFSRDPRVAEAVSEIEQATRRGEEHPKVGVLRELLTAMKPSDRALIFAGYRETVDQIHKMLVASGIRSWTLIGKQGETGQRQEEQVRAVESFRSGEYQALIATQIGEEGLDIAECNLVVFYDNVPSAIRYVQRRGRTGRRSSGRMVMLMVKGTSDEAYYWVVQRKLNMMKGVIGRLNAAPKRQKRPGTLDSFI
ncbi:MAG: hypothetical protein JRN29_02025, partial [Nitrososphaerota archaeon]|nr:hypothetical protein [Nitrososphaerota archaeon]